MLDFLKAVRKAPVVPAVSLPDVGSAAPVAEALAAGGVTVVEVLLRTPAALDGIAAMKQAKPDLLIAAGTVMNADDLDAALKAGADAVFTPGLTPSLCRALVRAGLPSVPGVATSSEAMVALESGFDVVKFFPAEAMGGPKTLSAIAGPLPTLRVIPTGGVTTQNARAYLDLKSVVGVAGTWIATLAAIEAGDFAGIETRAREALALAQ